MTRIILTVLLALMGMVGCATTYRVHVPQGEIKIKEVRANPLMEGTELFINTSSEAMHEALVFDGYVSKDEAIVFEGGMPSIRIRPIGYFKVGPAISRNHSAEVLVGFFSPGKYYTVMDFTTDYFGHVLEINTLGMRSPESPLQSKYEGQWVNHYTYLPSYYAQNVRLDVYREINVNQLLLRALSFLSRDKVVVDENSPPPSKPDVTQEKLDNSDKANTDSGPYSRRKFVNPRFPKMISDPDSTK